MMFDNSSDIIQRLEMSRPVVFFTNLAGDLLEDLINIFEGLELVSFNILSIFVVDNTRFVLRRFFRERFR
jgi:hypothetical protein